MDNELLKEKENKNPQLEEIEDMINLRTSVLECLSQKHPDRNQATELLTNAVKRKYIFYSLRDDKKDEMWVYSEGIYIPNGKSFIEEFCREILQKAYTESLSRIVYVKVREDSLINAEDFFRYDNIDEVVVLNGILNTRIKILLPFDSKKIFFNKIPIKYNPTSKCPKLEEYYKNVLATEEDILVMFEFLGDGLSKCYDFQKSLIQYGEGSNSKGISQSIIKRFFGSENCASVSLNQMTYDSSSVADLFGKFMNVAGDLDRQALKETGIFKQLRSGTDHIQAKRKYLNDLKFKNFAKMIFACNEFPMVYDNTFGFWRSWIILNYPFKFISKEEYDLLKEKGLCKIKKNNIFEKITTDEELSGLLNKAIEGLARLRKNKGYSQTKGTEEIKNFWIRKSSPFTAFCMDCCKEGDDKDYITKKELRFFFAKYCKKNRLRGGSDKEIKRILQDLFGAIENRKDIGEKREYVWEGLKLVRVPTISPKVPIELSHIEFPENHRNPNQFIKKDYFSKEKIIISQEDKKILEEFE